MSTCTDKAFLVFGGGNDRAVLAFLRALRLCEQRAWIVARTARDRVLKTSFKRDVHWIRPDHVLSLDVFSEALAHVRRVCGARPLVVLPATEYFNTFLLKHRREIEQLGCAIPLVDATLYARLTDKRTSTDFFAAAGIPVPKEISAATALTPSLIAKPLFNVSKRGVSLYPHLLATERELEEFQRMHDVREYFFQEYVQGESIYLLFYLPQTGGPGHVWSQRNLLQQPGGKSMLLAEASDYHQSSTARCILDTLRLAGFHGLGMVEMIRNGEREAFIEMNPRIWGPIQFCIDQQQPLLQAFIGDQLHGDPQRYVQHHPARTRRHYFWFGGLADTLGTGSLPTWHASKQTTHSTILRNLSCDVYLRRDSWRCFFRDLGNVIRTRWKREQPQV